MYDLTLHMKHVYIAKRRASNQNIRPTTLCNKCLTPHDLGIYSDIESFAGFEINAH
jgi:hypothetical protein